MEQHAARKLALDLMSRHGLTENGWRFGFDRAKSRLGQCQYTRRTITISAYMVSAATVEQVEQTMLHEIAHALLPPYDEYGKKIGHGRRWKTLAAQIGYTGQRTSVNPYRYANQREVAVAQTAQLSPARPALRVGDVGTIDHPGSRYDGMQFTVRKVNRSRYRVVTSGGTPLDVPFGLGKPV